MTQSVTYVHKLQVVFRYLQAPLCFMTTFLGAILDVLLSMVLKPHWAKGEVVFLMLSLCVCVCFFLITYLLAALGLRCCLRTFSSCAEQGLLLVVVRGLLIWVASLAAEHGLQGRQASVVAASELSSCGTWALLPRGTWNLPRPGIEPVSPALAGGCLTTGPPGKSYSFILIQTFPRFIHFIM